MSFTNTQMYTLNSHIDITRLGMKGCHVLQRPQHWRPQYGTYHKLPYLELGTPSTTNKSCQYEDKILTTLGHLTIQDLQHILRSIWEKQYAFLLYTLLQLDRQAIERQPNFEQPLNLMTGVSGLHQNRMILDTTGALTTTYYGNSEVLLSKMKTMSLQS